MTSWRRQILVGVALCLVFSCGCDANKSTLHVEVAPGIRTELPRLLKDYQVLVSKHVEVARGIRTKLGRRLKDYQVLVSNTGTVWLFASLYDGRILYRTWRSAAGDGTGTDRGEWSDKNLIHQAKLGWGGLGLRNLAAEFYEEGKPLLLWCAGSDAPHRHEVWQSRWNGQGWVDKKRADGLMTEDDISCQSTSDRSVWLLFTKFLEPRESYLVFVDWYVPVKPHYAVFQDGKWGPATAMAGRSRWNYWGSSTPALVLDTVGTLHAVYEGRSSTRFDYGPDVLRYWQYCDNAWKGPETIHDWGVQMERPSVAVDAEGTAYLVYDVRSELGLEERGSRLRIRRHGLWGLPKPVGSDARSALIDNDSQGRVYCFWAEPTTGHARESHWHDGEFRPCPSIKSMWLRVWDINEGSQAVQVKMPEGSSPVSIRLIPGDDGHMYLTWVKDGAVVIHRIMVSSVQDSSDE